MIAPILTKVTLPPLPAQLVERERLLMHLDARKFAKLILISAAVGFGKSTIVRHWLSYVSGESAWVALDSRDNNLHFFLGLIVNALQQIDGNIGHELAFMLEMPDLPPYSVLLAGLLNDLYHLPFHCYLVLDDYHLVDQPEIHDLMNYFLQHSPTNFTLIITSRYDPPLELSRLRARGQLVELRADVLKFSPDEVGQFMRAVTHSEVAPEALTTLIERTEGWVAGLQLAMIVNNSDSYLMDYLFDEVLAQQTGEVQDFLLQTSVLGRFCAELCDSVLECTDSHAMLEHLRRTNLFISVLDNDRHWYRYHALFEDLLHSWLAKRYGSNFVADLHRRAAQWFAENDLSEESLTHALAANDPILTLEIVEKYAYELLYREHIHTLQLWLDKLSPEIVHSALRLQFVQGWILARQMRIIDLRAHLEMLDSKLDGNSDPALIGELAALKSFLLLWEEAPLRRYQLAEQARTQVSSSNHFVHSQITQILALSYTGMNRLRDYERLLSTMYEIGNERAVLQALMAHSFISVLQGELDRATQACYLAITLSQRLNALESQSVVYQELGFIVYQRNQLKEAEEYYTKALTLGRDLYLRNRLSVPAYQLAWLLNLRGDTEASDRLIHEAADNARFHYTPGLAELVAGMQAHLWLRRGKRREALQWADAYNIDFIRMPVMHSITLGMRQMQCFLAEPSPQRLSRAALLVDQLLELALPRQLYGIAIYPLVQKALLLDQQNRTRQAQEFLIQALEIGKTQKNLRFVTEVEPGIELLLRRYLEENPSSDLNSYVYSLLSVIQADRTAQSAVLVDPLTERELGILRLLVAGLSNEQIAETLVVAIGTVKKHTSTIYTKLNVSNRTQAVIRAQELNLLRP